MRLPCFALVVLWAAAAQAADTLEITPTVQQGAAFVLSDEVTGGGLGGGLGVQACWRRHYVAQLDVSVLWGAGNSFVGRVAAGYQRDGRWSPAVWGTVNLLWGDRIERLADDGRRPARPTWATGARISPLRFAGAAGVLSALEPGVALGPGGALWLELMLLHAGARW